MRGYVVLTDVMVADFWTETGKGAIRMTDKIKIISAYIQGAISDDTEREKLLKFIDETIGNPTHGEMIEEILNIDGDCIDVHGENGTMTFTVSQEWWNTKEISE